MQEMITQLLLIAYGTAFAADIRDASLEQTATGIYQVRFEALADAFPVTIYASSKADQITSEQSVATIARSADLPFTIGLAGQSGRVYFHLKPRSGAARVVATRRLPLDGAPNFRDLGGYRTADGRYVKWGLVYRSGQLSGLTEKDYQYLHSLGIRLVCDFRIEAEQNRAPTKWGGEDHPEILSSSVDTINYATRSAGLAEHMKMVYNRMPFDGAAEFSGVLQRFARGNLPALVHCTSGKDRTGFFSAVLLLALGVPPETVQKDFELTNKYLAPDDKIPTLAKAMQERLKLNDVPDVNAVLAANGVDPAWLPISLSAISEKYGSLDGYLYQGLRLSDAELRILRDRLLE